jgi:hypothetical protein
LVKTGTFKSFIGYFQKTFIRKCAKNDNAVIFRRALRKQSGKNLANDIKSEVQRNKVFSERHYIFTDRYSVVDQTMKI